MARISKRRVPLGVVGVVYDRAPTSRAMSRPLPQDGNAVVLRGGSEALMSNQAIGAAILKAR